MNTFVALDPVLAHAPKSWRIIALRRITALHEEVNGSGSEQLLSLRSNGVVSRRDPELQPPSDAYLLRYSIVRPGELVVNPMWLVGGGIGVSELAGAMSPEYRVYTPAETLEARYLHHLVRSAPYLSQYRLLTRAETTFDRRVTKDDFSYLPILVPPIEEQRRIADYLDHETARIDALISKKRQLAAAVCERFEVLRRGSFDVQDWPRTRLAHVVECLDGKRVPLNTEERASMPGQYPYWGANAVVDWIDRYLFDEELVLLGEDGAPFFDRSRDVAFRVTGRIWVNNHAHVLRPRGVRPGFLTHYLNSVDYGQYISGSTRDKLTQSDMNAIDVPVPALEEQARLESDLAKEASQAERLEEVAERQIALLHEHRQALITAAVTGQLDIPGVAA